MPPVDFFLLQASSKRLIVYVNRAFTFARCITVSNDTKKIGNSMFLFYSFNLKAYRHIVRIQRHTIPLARMFMH